MFLARVKGHVVTPTQDPTLTGAKLLIVEPMRVTYGEDGGGVLDPTGRALVAVDRVGAGEDEFVLVVQGSSARMAEGCKTLPIDAAITGIVDEAVVLGKKLMRGGKLGA